MSEPSGQRRRVPFATYDRESCCWRTSRTSLPLENLPEPSVTWPLSGTWDHGGAYELPTPAHPTNAGASSSLLGTPRSSDGMKHPLREDVGNPRGRLEDQVALLPTAQARDGDSRTMSSGTAAKRMAAGKRNLDDAIALLPTPAARDWKSSASNILDRNARPLNEVVAHLLPTPQAADGERASRTMVRGNPTLIGALLPTPTATDAKSSSGANPAWSHNMTLTDAARSIGATTDPRSAAGSTSSDEQPPTLSLWDDEAGVS